MTTEAQIREAIERLEAALMLASNPSLLHTELYHARRALLWVLNPESAPNPAT